MGIADSIRNMANKAAEKAGADRAERDGDARDERSDETDRGAYLDHTDRGMDVARGQREIREHDRPAT